MIEPKFLKSEIHKKAWGKEIWLCNNEEFCGKILHINRNHCFSFHYHINKKEVFYILMGTLKLEYFNLTNADRKTKNIVAGNTIEIPRNCPHKLTALTNAIIIEFSTHHEDSDSYRIEKGDSQNV